MNKPSPYLMKVFDIISQPFPSHTFQKTQKPTTGFIKIHDTLFSKICAIIKRKSAYACQGPGLKRSQEMTDGTHPLLWWHLRRDHLDLPRGS